MTRTSSSASTGPCVDMERRHVLQVGRGLSIAFLLIGAGPARAVINARRQPGDAAAAAADGNPAFAPNAFIRIDTNGTVRLVMPNVEMGQGTYTGTSMLLAEELGVGLDQIKVEHSPASDELYASPILQIQATGGSTAIRGNWKVMREAGAVARTMLASAAAARWKVDPATCVASRGRIRHAPTGRSFGFGELAADAARLPQPKEVKLKDPKDFELIGKPLRRVETASKVNGTAQFAMDVRLPGMKVGTVMACPTFGGRLASVDDTRARAVAGVIDVVRLDNAVAVIGEHFWAAKKGMEALRIEWDRGVNSQLTTDDIAAALAKSSREGTVIVARQAGGAEPSAGRRIESIYLLPMLAHAPMEPLNTTVWVTPDKCEIWVGTQVPMRALQVAAKVTGLPPEKVTVHNHYIGGGFGRRLEVDSIEQAVAFAKQVAYPVKIVWTREEDIGHDYVRPMYYDRISATLDSDGFPAFWSHRITSPSIVARWLPPFMGKDGIDPDVVEGAEQPPYALPNIRVEWVRHDMPTGLVVGWWRGVGPTHNQFVVESFIDELAHAAGKHPLEYRRHLLRDNPRSLKVLNVAAEKIGAGQVLPARRGQGIAVGDGFGSHVCAIVEVDVSPQGVALRRAVVAIDCGVVVNPNSVVAQMEGGLIFGLSAALHNGITISGGAIEQSNFHDYRTLRINEAPAIEVLLVQGADTPGGIGEVATAVAAPALGNAIFAATGIRVRNPPFDRASLASGGGAPGKTAHAAPLDNREQRA